jgi:hypothetical protein
MTGTSIVIRRSASHNDITVNGTTVSLSPPGANREARRFLLETLFPDARLPRALQRPLDKPNVRTNVNKPRPTGNRQRKRGSKGSS